jgi:hypothetical protein
MRRRFASRARAELADYECMIIVNERGELNFFYGDDAKRGTKPRAFFIPPYHAPYTLTWSRGRRREKRDLRIERIDCRPQFMSFEFNTRTSDNVELVLEGTFFWQVEIPGDRTPRWPIFEISGVTHVASPPSDPLMTWHPIGPPGDVAGGER